MVAVEELVDAVVVSREEAPGCWAEEGPAPLLTWFWFFWKEHSPAKLNSSSANSSSEWDACSDSAASLSQRTGPVGGPNSS